MLSTIEPRVHDVTIETGDGLRLHAAHWSVPAPRGVAVVSHGFGEHGGAYEHVARIVGGAVGLDFVVPDLRGHGRSPGRRGVVRRYEDLTSDYHDAIAWAARLHPGLPLFAVGHSNGGQVVLRSVLDPHVCERIAGMILSNPALKIATHVPGYKIRLGRFLMRHAPGLTLKARLDPENMTRDPVMQQRHRDDTLAHGRMSPPLFFGMVEGGQLIAERAPSIRVPLLMILGGSDPVIDPETSRRVFDRLGASDKTLLLFPAMRHEPFNELGREQVFEDMISWLNDRLASQSDAGAA